MSSIVTFVLVAGLSHAGGAALVGSVAILQTIALIGLAAGRAMGVDVWAASGASGKSRRSALSSSVFIALLVVTANLIPWLAVGRLEPALGLYLAATPFIVLLDAARIMLLHASKTWISVAAQATTLAGLTTALLVSDNATIILGVYLVGMLMSISAAFIGLKMIPPAPSLSYPFAHRQKSGPFLFEITLGSITQQILFMLVAIFSSIETAGHIRIAQTLLGPMSILHSGLSPQLLRRLGRMRETSRRAIARAGSNFGLSLAAYSLLGAIALSVVLPLELSGVSILKLLTGQRDINLPPIIAICGFALACGAITLGTGTSARILGVTRTLNRWRLLLVIPQVVTVTLAAFSGNSMLAAAGLAAATAATAVVSMIVLTKHVGKKSRRAPPN